MDDAVVVLVTKNPNSEESESEYRVSYVENLENLYGIFDPVTGKWAGDSSIILDLFAEKDIFTDLDYALVHAQEINIPDGSSLVNGYCVIRDFQNSYFTDL